MTRKLGGLICDRCRVFHDYGDPELDTWETGLTEAGCTEHVCPKCSEQEDDHD